MRMALRSILWQPFYPWPLGIYPILHLYVENLGLVIDSEVMPSILLMLAGTSIAFYFINRQVRNIHLTAFLTSLCILAFSLSGHVYVLVFMPRSLGIWTLVVLSSLAIIIFSLRKTPLLNFYVEATPSFNLIALVLLTVQLIGLAAGLVESSKYLPIFAENIAISSPHQRAPRAEDSATRPDIYFIVPDSYPSDSWLKSTTNYDNDDFTRALEDRGFIVVNHAQSNYGKTLVSTSSNLNMRYYESNPSPYNGQDYLRLEAANSQVARLLTEMGYTYIQLLSGSFIPSPMADIIRDFTPQGTIDIKVDVNTISEALFTGALSNRAELELIERAYKRSFYNAFLDTTLLRLARSQLRKLFQSADGLPYDSSAPERFLETIEEVDKISAMPEATFTIVHLLKPHAPVVFNESGEPIPWNGQPTPEEFFAELRFVNSRFLHMIDSILATSKNPPIIMFQADHGSALGRMPKDQRFTFFDIYAAYFLPPQFAVDFPKPFTTVNAFPLILNAVFNTGYELQADRLFELPDPRYAAPFKQVDVTEEFLNKP